MRVILTMFMLAVVSSPGPARAQSSAGEPLEVPVHPRVTTVLHLPDDIEHARFTARVAGSVRATISKHLLYVRPYRSAPAGMKIALEVTTATMHQRFRLRVTRHARDASRMFVVPVPEPEASAAEPVPGTGETTPDAAAAARTPVASPDAADALRTPVASPDAADAARTPVASPDAADAARSQVAPDAADTARTQPMQDAADTPRTTASTPDPATPAPRAGREPARAGPVIAAAASEQIESVTAAAASEQIESVTAAAAARAPRFELAVHALVALPGFTSLEPAGARPGVTWRAHRGLGVRLTAGPAGGCWNLEADVSGTWLTGTLTYYEGQPESRLDVIGPLLRTELGVRAGAGARWRSSVYAGLGMQAHLRWTKGANSFDRSAAITTMADGVVLALGIGLHRRIGDVLLGLEVQVRRGGPDDYHSMTALWTVGYFLDPGP